MAEAGVLLPPRPVSLGRVLPISAGLAARRIVVHFGDRWIASGSILRV